MLQIDSNGHAIHKNIKLKISLGIQKKPLIKVSGLVVHQTGGSTVQSAFNNYKIGSAGAHFLIDKDGTIYQTASLTHQTWHVGKLKARCLVEKTCTPTELKLLGKFSPRGEHKREMAKKMPARYPANHDSLGIEIVGEALPKNVPEEKRVYETVTKEQNASLKWLVGELRTVFSVPLTDVFRHPTVSRKNPTEAATAKW